MGGVLRDVDVDIVEEFGTSAGNAYFVEDMVMPDIIAGDVFKDFVGSDGSEVTFDFELDALVSMDRDELAPDEVERACAITCRRGGEATTYRTDAEASAFEHYLDEAGDVRLVDSETYSQVAFARHLRDDAHAAIDHCLGAIADFRRSRREFDAEALCDVRERLGEIERRAASMGIDTHHTPFGPQFLDVERERLSAGLFADNVEIDTYSDMYKDQYGVRLRTRIAEYLGRGQEDLRREAVDEYEAQRMGDDEPARDVPDERPVGDATVSEARSPIAGYDFEPDGGASAELGR